MNKQQQADLQTWKDNPQAPLPESLANVFIDRCLEEVPNIKNKFNKISEIKITTTTVKTVKKLGSLKRRFVEKYETPQVRFKPYFEYVSFVGNVLFEDLSESQKIYIILTLLSRTQDGEAIMSFLDTHTIEYKKLEDGFYTDYWLDGDIILTYIRDNQGGKTIKIYKCLRKQLKDQFIDALTEEGKTLKQALETINKTYLLHFYE